MPATVTTNRHYDSGNAQLGIDANGNPRVVEATVGGVAQPNVYYGVDDVNRANYDSTTAPSRLPVPAADQTDTYDKANFVTQGSAIAVQQYYGDGEIEQATTTGPDPQTASFAYDPEQDRIGESTPTATTSYAFDAAGQMCWSAPTASIPAGGSTPGCSSPPAGATTDTYDGDGLRESETTSSGTQSFAWDTETGTPRLLEDGQDDYVYGPGGTPLAQVAIATGAVEWLVSDREGSVRDVVSGTTGLSCRPSRNSLTLPSRNSLVRRALVVYSIVPPLCRRGSGSTVTGTAVPCTSAVMSAARAVAEKRPSPRPTTTTRCPRRRVTSQSRPSSSASSRSTAIVTTGRR